MSALYLSKVAPQGSDRSLLKQAQDQSSASGKRVKITKMAEEPEQRTDDLHSPSSVRHQQGPEDICGVPSLKPIPTHLSKEELYEQRQKCELKRLLKHTHPELKMLDEVVDEELAEVLGSESGVTADETGYEGEVQSRRLLFENCALSSKVSPYTHKMHMAERITDGGNISKTPTVFQRQGENTSVQGTSEDDRMLGANQDTKEEFEEEIRIDVQAARRKFENQSAVSTSTDQDKKHQRKVSGYWDGTRKVQKQECRKEKLNSQNKSNACTESTDLKDTIHKQDPCIGQTIDKEILGRELLSSGENSFDDELPDQDNSEEIIKTSAALFQNNPFIPNNIEKEHTLVHVSRSPGVDSQVDQNYQTANVKNRAHVFESMPFHKIRQQNQDEIETMVENIKEILDSLYSFNVIHLGGSIIEVNETMLAKKAKFTVTDNGPEISYDEVAEGGAQNFILQLLPRANLKPQITYLKEGSDRNIATIVVNVPIYHHQSTSYQDTEFKTANVVQVVEDILNQDNSLRKGVIFQEDRDRCAEVIVYSLYKYFDPEDVKTYSPPHEAGQDTQVTERGEENRIDNQEPSTGFVESRISSLLHTSHDHTCQGSNRPEIEVKGNVKLFKSCIEKGDLEYLRTLQAETFEDEGVPPSQQGMELYHEERDGPAVEGTPEWIPVDVKRLKTMFSGDGRPVQPKQSKYLYESHAQATTIVPNVPVDNSKCSAESKTGAIAQSQLKSTFKERDVQVQREACGVPVAPQGSYLHLETQDMVHQAELVEVVDDNDEISDLQAAILSLQQATKEAKSLQDKHEFLNQESKEPDVSSGNVKERQKEKPSPELQFPELPSSISLSSEDKSEILHENTEICQKDSNPKGKQSTVGQEREEVVQEQFLEAAIMSSYSSATASEQQDDEEVVLQGKLKAALESLERSNINVTRGDFRAAMIYRNASKPQAQSGNFLVTDIKPAQEEVCKRPMATENLQLPNQCESPNKPTTSQALEKSRRPTGPKPIIPPKPEHLKLKQRCVQSSTPVDLETTPANTTEPRETEHQPLGVTPTSHKNEHQMSQENEAKIQTEGSVIALTKDNTKKIIISQQQGDGKGPEDLPNKEGMSETDESHVDFHEACRKFESKKEIRVKRAPVKPKRVKIAKQNPKEMPIILPVVEEAQQNRTGPLDNNPNSCGQTSDTKDDLEKQMEQESKVEMRLKKGRTETEDERRQRLSVHMDEIMRGNITAAMEIFDNLRKHEELKSILCRVEEIEQDTSEVDVRALRRVFENVPDWVVCTEKKKLQKEKVENKEERFPPSRDNTESKSSMAHVFGDLERASEEIINLKEQTLARLMDIEETIKKALYSVSTLKSDSDIAGLSSLFKESLGTVQGSPSSGNIRKLSIGSSRTKPQPRQGDPAKSGLPVHQNSGLTGIPAKQQTSPPSSPAFISIQSTARKTDTRELALQDTTICPTCQHSSKTEEKFRTTKTLTCNSPAQNRKRDPRKGGTKQLSYDHRNPKREICVQTDREGNGIMGTKTITENYERTDNFGNRFYSSKTSTVVTTQPETTTSTGLTVATPATCQVTTYPEVRLPINQKP
ncbi:LIM domain-containing protein isoform X2 [Cheilinus undulatus]|nr:LIM domain-containing protein isoform X2 [Cheilinus undulatus]